MTGRAGQVNRMVREETGVEGSLQGSCLEDPRIRKHVSHKYERGELESSNWSQLGVVIYIVKP